MFTKKMNQIILGFAFAMISLAPFNFVHSAKPIQAGSFAIDLPLVPISQLNLLALGSSVGFKYHMTDNFVIAPGIGMTSSSETETTTSSYKDTNSSNELLLGLYYLIPYSEHIMIEMGPSFGIINSEDKDQTSSTNTIETKTSGSSIALNFRPMILFSNEFGIYANLAYYTKKEESKETPTTGAVTTETKESNYLYSTFGFVWYL